MLLVSTIEFCDNKTINMNIVITGSLGNISKPLTKNLISQGHEVTVISSNKQRKQDIETLGAKAAIGSLLDINFITQCFAGSDAVYCMVPPNYAHSDQLTYYTSIGKSYENAIRKSEIKKVVHLSSYGAHLPSGTGFITGSYQVEQILNTISGITLTHIRPTSFYYNLLAFIDMIKTAGFIGAVYGGEDTLAMVSPKDIATAVAEEILLNDIGNKIRYVASDDRTCAEVATVLGKAIGKPDLKWLVLPKENVIQALQKHGMNNEVSGKLVELGDAIHTGKLREDYDIHKPAMGKVKLEEYANEFAQFFNSK